MCISPLSFWAMSILTLSNNWIAHLILHILFLENSKSVTLISKWPGGSGGGGGGRGGGWVGEDCTVQNFGPICIIKPKMNQIRRKWLTFHKNQQPTPRIYKKVAASRRQPALLAGGYASPLQLQDRRPDRRLLADSRHRRRRRHTSRTDTTDHSTYHHQIPTPATDSRNHAITNHQETNYTASFSRIVTVEKAKNQVTGDEHCTDPVPPCKHRGRVPYTWKVRAPDVTSTKYKVIAKAAILSRDDEEFNVDLPAYIVYHQENKHWTLIKEQTSKFHDVGWYEHLTHRTALQEKRQTAQHSVLVRHPGEILQWPLRGRWRTTTSSPGAAKLPWHDLLLGQTCGTRTWVRTPNRLLGEDTLLAPGRGHPLGSWVRTPTLHLTRGRLKCG